MANINLLPWREAQRRERQRATVIACAAIWLGAAILVLLGGSLVESQISHQEQRNNYLQGEIRSLSRVISEIENLRAQRDALVARMEVIQSLQANRTQIVHVFDDLVTKLPKGAYFESIDKNDQRLHLDGKAQSNGRVSAFMRNLDASDWFTNPDLKVVDVIDQNGTLLSDFDVEVRETGLSDAASDGIETVQ